MYNILSVSMQFPSWLNSICRYYPLFFNGCAMIQFILFVFPACFFMLFPLFLDVLLKLRITHLLLKWVNWVSSFNRALEIPLVVILRSALFYFIFLRVLWTVQQGWDDDSKITIFQFLQYLLTTHRNRHRSPKMQNTSLDFIINIYQQTLATRRVEPADSCWLLELSSFWLDFFQHQHITTLYNNTVSSQYANQAHSCTFYLVF